MCSTSVVVITMHRYCMAESVIVIAKTILFVCDSGPPWFIKAEDKKPQFVAWPASADVKLRCAADGEPPLKYQWLKNGKVLNYRRLDPKYVQLYRSKFMTTCKHQIYLPYT